MTARRVAVIVVAAGSGTRLGADLPKAFVPLAGRTILEHALHSVAGMARTPHVVVVAPGHLLAEARTVLERVIGSGDVVPGGATRQASVAAGLALIGDAEIVLVHDAARALAPAELFDRVVDAVERTGAGAVPGMPVADTIKRTDASGAILDTVDRDTLAAVQTPQGFPADQLIAAYAAAGRSVTDDAQLIADAGHPAHVVPGDPLAFKITTAWDLHRAEELLREASVTRIGVGTDTHAFSDDPAAPLWVACLEWPGERGLSGHSDGDPVAHAIVDALLSAAGLGDIGGVFGTSDLRFAGAHGDVFLSETRRLLTEAGWRIENVSVQLIGNRPRFAPRKAEADAVLSELLGAPVAVTATTTDGLGFTGRGEGLAAIATALLTR
ncbi:2-C-methyl-D-erythritol 4-phosphate cytidylyltransferase [Gryllotalpicola ginsengisoli]|uniref:2-C-methyl-D-erythritol 4-phosphate cytidylyltransferase n=1 Tax=Gryllotalpicola ginsengisoli TaxID=444608 RepID=UPI0003B436D3|nr:2-C-methyl-D-erythritol 4-phosphate cytidylyltransferase [Gryllotalpicola ginsengisoli]